MVYPPAGCSLRKGDEHPAYTPHGVRRTLTFYPHNAMLSQALAMALCLCLCLSVTSWRSIEMVGRIEPGFGMLPGLQASFDLSYTVLLGNSATYKIRVLSSGTLSQLRTSIILLRRIDRRSVFTT